MTANDLQADLCIFFNPGPQINASPGIALEKPKANPIALKSVFSSRPCLRSPNMLFFFAITR